MKKLFLICSLFAGVLNAANGGDELIDEQQPVVMNKQPFEKDGWSVKYYYSVCPDSYDTLCFVTPTREEVTIEPYGSIADYQTALDHAMKNNNRDDIAKYTLLIQVMQSQPTFEVVKYNLGALYIRSNFYRNRIFSYLTLPSRNITLSENDVNDIFWERNLDKYRNKLQEYIRLGNQYQILKYSFVVDTITNALATADHLTWKCNNVAIATPEGYTLENNYTHIKSLSPFSNNEESLASILNCAKKLSGEYVTLINRFLPLFREHGYSYTEFVSIKPSEFIEFKLVLRNTISGAEYTFESKYLDRYYQKREDVRSHNENAYNMWDNVINTLEKYMFSYTIPVETSRGSIKFKSNIEGVNNIVYFFAGSDINEYISQFKKFPEGSRGYNFWFDKIKQLTKLIYGYTKYVQYKNGELTLSNTYYPELCPYHFYEYSYRDQEELKQYLPELKDLPNQLQEVVLPLRNSMIQTIETTINEIINSYCNVIPVGSREDSYRLITHDGRTSVGFEFTKDKVELLLDFVQNKEKYPQYRDYNMYKLAMDIGTRYIYL